jgi:hypothetical protein
LIATGKLWRVTGVLDRDGKCSLLLRLPWALYSFLKSTKNIFIMQGAWHPLMQPTMVQSKAFNIITWQFTPTTHQEGTPYLTHGMWWLILWFWALGTFTSTQSSLVENICMTTSYHWFGSINQVLIEVPVPSQDSQQSYTMYIMCVRGII